jgi:hypothetical protein
LDNTLNDHANSFFTLAAEFINNTSRSVFLTGKAGTGKTTFLKYICENTHKNFVVAAPTGVAAINAGGMTLHSLFQLPFGIYLPGYREPESRVPVTNRNSLFKNLRLSRTKRQLLQELELLVIDEVSMVRCDMLDATDVILRTVRKNQMPFGGVQVLFIGDLYQLSPVAGKEEWDILKEHYESPFFFHAHVVKQTSLLCIELTKIYRQSEQRFIDLLNNIRNNEVTHDNFQLLNSRLLKVGNTDDFVTLTTHNYKADALNEQELQRLTGAPSQFSAIIKDDFPERNYPTEPVLVLKVGAKVMFIKNDTSEEKLYYNGKLATVTEINDDDEVTAQFEDGRSFTLTTETWRNIRYRYNAEKDEIEEEELGSFTQYPIRLAWAITIHKSQGLTFQKAIVDAGSSFAPGQVYVALSRCTSLDGLILKTPITTKQISTDPVVVAYSKFVHSEAELTGLLQQDKEAYEKKRIISLFDFTNLQQAIVAWAAEVPNKKLPDPPKAITLTKELIEQSNALMDVAGKTQQWIERNFVEAQANNNYEKLLNGLTRSVNHFNALLHDDFLIKLQTHYLSLKGKSKVKKYLKDVKELADIVAGKAKKIKKSSWKGKLLFDGEEKPTYAIPEDQKVDKEVKPKGSSGWETLALFQRGLDVQKIAEMRGLAVSTIEGHLFEQVKAGKLLAEKLVSPEKMNAIRETQEKLKAEKLSELKTALGDEFSYIEIRTALHTMEVQGNPQSKS